MLSRVERTWRDRIEGLIASAGPLGRALGETTGDGWRFKPWVRRYRWLILFVIAPTVAVTLYLFLIAAPQYVSESKFLIRTAQPTVSAASLGSLLGGAATPATAEEGASVRAYLLSHDAAQALRRQVDILTMFKRPRLDFYARLNGDPTAEGLLSYYKRQVKVKADRSTGVTTLTVRAFAPGDARAISEALLVQSEQFVNRLNDRANADAMQVARAELVRSQGQVADAQARLAAFRTTRGSIDPERSGVMVSSVIQGIESELARARSELAVQSAFLRPGNPKLVALQSKVASLQAQVASQNARLVGSAQSLAPTLGTYERLVLEKEFADKEYAAALAAVDAARVDVQKKHLYLVRLVRPNLPEKALYPQRAFAALTIFVTLLVAYGIAWLIIAGIREHAG